MKKYRYEIEGCRGCDSCRWECNAGAIEFTIEGVAVIDQAKCVGCGACYNTCPAEAVRRIPVEE